MRPLDKVMIPGIFRRYRERMSLPKFWWYMYIRMMGCLYIYHTYSVYAFGETHGKGQLVSKPYLARHCITPTRVIVEMKSDALTGGLNIRRRAGCLKHPLFFQSPP